MEAREARFTKRKRQVRQRDFDANDTYRLGLCSPRDQADRYRTRALKYLINNNGSKWYFAVNLTYSTAIIGLHEQSAVFHHV